MNHKLKLSLLRTRKLGIMSPTSKVIPQQIEHRPLRQTLKSQYSEIGRKIRNVASINENVKVGVKYTTSLILIVSIVGAIGMSMYLGLICYDK